MGLLVGWFVGFCFFFAQEMSCYLETAVCKGNICVIKALTNYRVVTLSPGLLKKNSLSLSSVSKAPGSAAMPDIFCPGAPLGEISQRSGLPGVCSY